MSQMSLVKAERALENRAHVRMLLRLRQPAFAAALASAEQDVFTDRRGVARQTCACSAAAGFSVAGLGGHRACCVELGPSVACDCG